MMAAADLATWMPVPVAAVSIWLLLACLMPRLPRRAHRRAGWTLALAGVPVLGLSTLNWGPGAGMLCLGLGLLLLLRRPAPRRAAPAATPEGQP